MYAGSLRRVIPQFRFGNQLLEKIHLSIFVPDCDKQSFLGAL